MKSCVKMEYMLKNNSQPCIKYTHYKGNGLLKVESCGYSIEVDADKLTAEEVCEQFNEVFRRLDIKLYMEINTETDATLQQKQ